MWWLAVANAGYLAGTADEQLTTNSGVLEGVAVGGGHDLDGDGYPEVLVSDHRADNDKGVVHLFWGNGESVDSVPDTLTATVRDEEAQFGWSLTTVDDMDGDGLAEVMVGSPFAKDPSNGGVYGAAYVFSGGGTVTQSWQLFSLGGAGYDQGGHVVANAGDLDNDGYGDAVFTAVGAYAQGGEVLLVFGGTGQPIVGSIVGPDDSRYFGQEVVPGGDLDGDGKDDLVIAGNTVGTSGDLQAHIWVMYGGDYTLDEQDLGTHDYGFGTRMGAVGDVDGDGAADLLIGDPLAGESDQGAAWIARGDGAGGFTTPLIEAKATTSVANGYFGHGVAVVGDIDLDGTDDVVVGHVGAHKALVYEGSSGGTADHTLTGGNYLGFDVQPLGDINGDQHADFIAGSWGFGGYLFLGCVDTDADGVCKGVDCDDVDGLVGLPTVPLYVDADGDGYGAGSSKLICAEDGWVEVDGDCDDADPQIHPDAAEGIGDGIDQNCDGSETCWVDADADGYTDGSFFESQDTTCPGEPQPGDCDDTDADSSPLGVEVCGDGVDQDCSGHDLECPPDTGDTAEAPVDSTPWASPNGMSGGCGHAPAALGLWWTLVLVRRRC